MGLSDMLPGPSDPFWITLLYKMLATAALVVSVSMLVERVGPFLGAMVATLPISAGPALVFVAMDRGPAFLEASARAGLPAFAGTAVFAVVYALLAQRRRTLISVGGSLAAWLVATLLIQSREWSLGAALALHGIVFGTALRVTRPYRRAAPVVRATRRSWDVPFRAAIVMALVATVLVAGRLLGPRTAGTIAVAPMVFASVGLVLQPRVGGALPAAMMANGLLGLIGLVVALAFLSVSATALGAATSLSLALLICVLWNLLLIGARRLRR
jgi:uncharacterized membrane protein (GlpM family)